MPLKKKYLEVSLHHSDNSHMLFTDTYGAFHAKNVDDYIPYCSLKLAILDFYNLELEYSQRKFFGSFWHDKHEAYYRKRLVDAASSVVRFTIAAAVGEARHFSMDRCGCLGWMDGDLERAGYAKSRGEYAAKVRKGKLYLQLLFGGMGFPMLPQSRDIVYRAYVPESAFLKYLAATRYIFHALYWGGSYGGVKWGNGCDHAIRLYRAICVGSFSEIAIRLDTLINHFHNGGLLLNKFACYSCKPLDWLLDMKQTGDLEELNDYFARKPCSYWGRNCNRVIRMSPIGGRNGKRSVAFQSKKKEQTKAKEKSVFVNLSLGNNQGS